MVSPLSYAEYPGLDPVELGLVPNSGYGAIKGIRCHAADAGRAAVLSSTVSLIDTELEVVDASKLPDVPFTLQAGAEKILAYAIEENVLMVTRGHDSTRAMVHPAGRMLYEVRDSYVYLIAGHPVSEVSAVYVDGSRLLEGYTIYTGQAGDELPGYEGRAVLSLNCQPCVGRQYNIPKNDALARASGTREESRPTAWSSREIVDGMSSTFTLVSGADARPTAWVAFERTYGTVLGQSYEAEVENASATEMRVAMTVRHGGVPLTTRQFEVQGGTRTKLTLWRGPGQEDDELVLSPLDGQLRAYSMTKILTLDDSLSPEPIATMELPPSGPFSGSVTRLSALGRTILRGDYPSGPSGTVKSERHYIDVKEGTGTGDARVRVVAGGGVFREAVIKAGKSERVSLCTEGGAWQTPTTVVALMGEISVTGMSKTVDYYPSSTGPAHEAAGASSASIVVGRDVRVDAGLAVDTDGAYAGEGMLIERPDHVMRHFLIEHLGFDQAMIDRPSFDSAGALYESAVAGGYRFSFVLSRHKEPTGLLRAMAAEARSTLNCDRGQWELNFLPDTAPPPIKTVSNGDLVDEGMMFVFSRTPIEELTSTLVARYGPRQGASGWEGVVSVTDSAVELKYGKRVRETELALIRNRETAESVLGHMLMQRANPLLRVTFPVFYEHFDLKAGDTIDIDNPLYGGRRFLIESISRRDKFTAEVKAMEWWG